MEQLDFFQKMETQVETSCKRIEGIYLDLMNDLEPIDPKSPNAKSHEMYVSVDRKLIPVLQYLESFKWEVSLYPYEKTLRENGLKCIEK